MAFRHGMSGTPLNKVWNAMRQRCNNTRCREYQLYGGRGIAVCARWNDFVNFAADMGPHPGRRWSLDRIDNNGDYHLGNCRWATQKMQVRNSRKAKLTQEQANEIRALYKRDAYHISNSAELAKNYGVSRSNIKQVLNHTWR